MTSTRGGAHVGGSFQVRAKLVGNGTPCQSIDGINHWFFNKMTIGVHSNFRRCAFVAACQQQSTAACEHTIGKQSTLIPYRISRLRRGDIDGNTCHEKCNSDFADRTLCRGLLNCLGSCFRKFQSIVLATPHGHAFDISQRKQRCLTRLRDKSLEAA